LRYHQFGRSGLYVSPLALGSWRMDRCEDDEVDPLIDEALDSGINFIDTAPRYGGGQAEVWIGEALKRRGDRDRVVLATKSSGPNPREPDGFLSSRRHVIAACEASLRRLQTDRIDLFQVHCAEPLVPIDETLSALTDLQRAGKIRYAGCSNFKGWQLVEAAWCAKEYGYAKFVSDQSEYHLLDRRLEATNFPPMQTYGMAALIYSPLSQGVLTGKYAHGYERTPDDAIQKEVSPAKRDQFYGDRVQGPVRELIALAEERGTTATALALAFVIDQPCVGAAIIGPRHREQLRQNLAAAEVEVDDDLRAAWNRINPPGEKIHGQKLNLYNHGPTARWW